MLLLLDTTVLIDALRMREERRALLADLVGAGHGLAIAAISVAEVYAGMRPHEEAKTAALLARLPCFAITESIAKRAGLLRNGEARLGRTMSLADALIAATALEQGRTLVTDNRKDFLHSGVSLYLFP